MFSPVRFGKITSLHGYDAATHAQAEALAQRKRRWGTPAAVVLGTERRDDSPTLHLSYGVVTDEKDQALRLLHGYQLAQKLYQHKFNEISSELPPLPVHNDHFAVTQLMDKRVAEIHRHPEMASLIQLRRTMAEKLFKLGKGFHPHKILSE